MDKTPLPCKRVVRCSGPQHVSHPGNILCALEGNRIYLKCQDRGCSRWSRISLSFPGLSLDLAQAGIVQETLPEGYHLHLEPATTVVPK